MVIKIDIKRKMTENCTLNRHVISGSIVKLLELIDYVCGDCTEIVGYNTDAVYCKDPIKEYPEKRQIKTDMTGQVVQKNIENPLDIHKKYRKNIDIEEYTLNPAKVN